MPRGRKKKLNKPIKAKKLKTQKPKKDISKEVQDAFFNEVIPEEDVKETELDEIEDATETVDATDDIQEVPPESGEVEQKDSQVDDSEQVIVISTYSDDGDERQILQTIRKNPPPRESWADKKSRFKGGQFIMPIKLTKDKFSSYECTVVISASTEFDTYAVKHSRCMNETIIKGCEWVIADAGCKPYINYWDLVSPIIKMKK